MKHVLYTESRGRWAGLLLCSWEGFALWYCPKVVLWVGLSRTTKKNVISHIPALR